VVLEAIHAIGPAQVNGSSRSDSSWSLMDNTSTITGCGGVFQGSIDSKKIREGCESL